MKRFGILSVATMLFSCGMAAFGQGIEPEVPGDNFNLQGALELFKKSASPQDFEERLNSPDAKVNNLDLNGDGYIDYIRVFDREDRNVHVFILQAVISERESQDVAVIELEKQANGKAVLQIIGDEDLYGIETIIEPTREVYTYAGTTTSNVQVNVWSWPVVRYVYGPMYTSLWVSPFTWYVHPRWWQPWRPVAYVYYAPLWNPFRPYYALCYSHRVVYAHHIYAPYRRTSVVVHTRYNSRVVHYRSNHPHGHAQGKYASHTVGRSRSNYQHHNTPSNGGSHGNHMSSPGHQQGSRSSGANRMASSKPTSQSMHTPSSQGSRYAKGAPVMRGNNGNSRSQMQKSSGSSHSNYSNKNSAPSNRSMQPSHSTPSKSMKQSGNRSTSGSMHKSSPRSGSSTKTMSSGKSASHQSAPARMSQSRSSSGRTMKSSGGNAGSKSSGSKSSSGKSRSSSSRSSRGNR